MRWKSNHKSVILAIFDRVLLPEMRVCSFLFLKEIQYCHFTALQSCVNLKHPPINLVSSESGSSHLSILMNYSWEKHCLNQWHSMLSSKQIGSSCYAPRISGHMTQYGVVDSLTIQEWRQLGYKLWIVGLSYGAAYIPLRVYIWFTRFSIKIVHFKYVLLVHFLTTFSY